MKKNTFDILFRDKPALMLIELNNTDKEIYASILAKKIDCTYSHIVKILKHFENKKIIEVKKTGRLKLLNLTPKGKKIAKAIEEIKKATL